MDVFDAVRTVLAVRKYQDKPIPPEVTERILRSAWLTASSMNLQPWHFILVEERETLGQIGALIKTGRFVAQAAMAVVVVIEKTLYAESDASRAVQSMILTAWDAGVGSCWTGFYDLDGVKPLLGIPAELEVLAVIPFGYPAQPTGKGKKNRKPFDEVVSRGKYSEA